MMKGRKYFGLLILVFAAVLFGACYQPAANRTDEFANEEAPKSEISDSGVSNTSNVSSENSENPETNTMKETKTNDSAPAAGFRANVSQQLSKHGYSAADVFNESDQVELRLLNEYGAIFLTKALPPSKMMYTSESDVLGFQTKAGATQIKIGGIGVELQRDAAQALSDAEKEARASGESITPRDPKDSARRSFQHTKTLWDGRVEKACDHWKSKGKLTAEKIAQLKSLPIKQQVAQVFALEKNGIYFSTNFDKSILYSVAAPGASQHLAMLAFDAKEFGNKKVRKTMAKHGWFRTVQSDAPHFTYLGYDEKELPSLGLKKVNTADGEFWIPDV